MVLKGLDIFLSSLINKTSLFLKRSKTSLVIFKNLFSHITIKVVIDKRPRDRLRKRFPCQGRHQGEKWIFFLVHFIHPSYFSSIMQHLAQIKWSFNWLFSCFNSIISIHTRCCFVAFLARPRWAHHLLVGMPRNMLSLSFSLLFVPLELLWNSQS